MRFSLILALAVVIGCVMPVSAATNHQVGVDPGQATQLVGQWQEYFGVHADMGASDPWEAVRAPAGFGWKIRPEVNRTGPVRDKVFGSGTLRMGLDSDIVNNAGFDANTILGRLRDREKVSIFNMLDRQPVPLDRDEAYWALRLMYEKDAAYFRDNLYIQLGNEINGVGQWNPWPNAFTTINDPGKIAPYAESFFTEAVKASFQASRDVYGGDREAIKILGPSVAETRLASTRAWLRDLMNYTIQGHYTDPETGQLVDVPWSGLEGAKVHEHVDILSVHYPFQNNISNGRSVLQELHDEYIATGKVEGIWITEEHAGAGGPATMTATASRYAEWVADNGLSPDQSRLFWFNTTSSSAPGGQTDPIIRTLGEWVGGRGVSIQRQSLTNAELVILINDIFHNEARYTFIYEPTTEHELGGIRLHLSEELGDLEWSAMAVQTSLSELAEAFEPGVLVEGDEVRLNFERMVDGPLLITMTATVPEPGTAVLLLLGVGSAMMWRRRGV